MAIALFGLLALPSFAIADPTVTATKEATTTAGPGGSTQPGGTIDYKITIKNTSGAETANGVSLTDTTAHTADIGSFKVSVLAFPDAYNAVKNTNLVVSAPGVLTNDTGVPPPTATVISNGPTTAGGTVTLNADGSFNYLPPLGFTGTDTFTYTVTNNQPSNDTALVTITVANGVPTITDTKPAAVTMDEDGSPTAFALTLHATDPDGDTLTWSISLAAGHGTATASGTGTSKAIGYTPTADYNGSDSFIVQVSDGNGGTDTITVNVTINAVNDAPILTAGATLNYTENQVATVIDTTITLTDVDSANMASATVQITSNYVNGQDILALSPSPQNGITGTFSAATGTLTLTGSATKANYVTALKSVTYFNNSNDPSALARTVTWVVNDGTLSSAPVTSTINVTAVNDPPTATGYTSLPAQAGIPISYPAGKLGGTDVEAGTTVTIVTTPDSQTNGTVTINADGSFTFTPLPNQAGTNNTASFTYHVMDNGSPGGGVASAPATVSFTVAGPAIYFVKNPAVGSGNCTLGNECLLSTAVTNISAATNTRIFIEDGNTHTGPATLNSNGWVIGQGVTADFDTLFGISAPAQGTLAARPATKASNGALTNPTITTSVASTNGITLSSGNTVRGLTVGNTTGAKIFGSNFGTLTVGNNTTADVTLSGTGKALDLTTGILAATSGFTSVATTSSTSTGITLDNVSVAGGGTVSFGSTSTASSTTEGILVRNCTTTNTCSGTIAFGNTTVSGGTDGVSFTNNNAGTRSFGTLGVSGSSGNAFKNIKGANANGGGNVTVSGAATLSSANSAVNVADMVASSSINFQGSVTATSTGSGNIGVALSGSNGGGATLTFNSLTIDTNAGTGLSVAGGGSVTVTNGSGPINSTPENAPAIIANGVSLNANFSSVSSSGGANGISLTSVTGTSNFGTGSLAGSSGVEFLVSGGGGSVTYNGTITQTTAARVIDIQSKTAGTMAFGGTITSNNGTGQGIFLNSNTGATINFTNALNLSTGANPAFTATGGGTISATNTTSTLTTTTGTALNVANTTISNSNLKFLSITSNTASANPGIVLNTTGNSGGLIVIGSGGACTSAATCTGGSISNKTTNGISLTSTFGTSLSNMNISTNGNTGGGANGILGTTVTNLSLIGCNISNNGLVAGQDEVNLTDLFGTCAVTNTTISGSGAPGTPSGENNLHIVNNSGTLTLLTLTGNTFKDTRTTTVGNDGFLFIGHNSAIATIVITGTGASKNNFLNNAQYGVQIQALDSSNVTATVESATFTDNVNGVLVENNSNGHMTATIGGTTAALGNTITAPTLACNTVSPNACQNGGFYLPQTAIEATNFNLATASSDLRVKILHNTVNHPKGSVNHAVIIFGSSVNGVVAPIEALIDSNTVTDNGQFDGIHVNTPDTNTNPKIDVTVTNNNVTANDTYAGSGTIAINCNYRRADTGTFKIENNTTSAPLAGSIGIQLRRTLGTVRLERGSSASNTPSVVLGANNPLATGNTAINVVTDGTISVVNNGTIIPPLLFAPSGVDTHTAVTKDALLDQVALDSTVATATQRWEATGLTKEQVATLHNLTFEAADLPAPKLGEADGNHIRLDRAAAGNGWNITASTKNGRVDLLTAIMHEIGHALGLPDTYDAKDRDKVMYGYLTTGERRVPATGDALGAAPNAHAGPQYLNNGSAVTIGDIPPGKTVVVTFSVQVENPLVPANTTQISNQGRVSGTNFTTVNGVSTANPNTDDPTPPGAADPTVTQLCSNPAVVTTTADAGAGSLRQAITDVCDGGTITFNIPTADPGYNAGTGLYTIAEATPYTVSKSLTITGGGVIVVDAGNAHAVLTVTGGAFTVNLSGMTFTKGNSGTGGAINNTSGNTMTLTNMNVTASASTSLSTGGGGIFNGGTLTVINSTISGNTSTLDGGGIYNSGTGKLTVARSTVSGNSANNDGGGILNANGSSTSAAITDSTISGNSTTNLGGGIRGLVNLNNSTISDNHATDVGSGGGGGILGGGTWTNVTIVNNSAGNSSGGASATPLVMGNSIIANNTAPFNPDLASNFTSLGNNLVKTRGSSTGYVASDLPDGTDPALGILKNNGGPTFTHLPSNTSPANNAGGDRTTLTSGIDNAVTSFDVGDASSFIPGVGFAIQIDNEQMIVTAKAGNTLTVTRGANATTAAAHSGGASVNSATDQRGFPRKIGGALDIGAVEANYKIEAVSGSTPQSAAVTTNFAVPLAAFVSESSFTPVNNVVVTFTAPGSEPTGNFSGSPSTTATSDSTGFTTPGLTFTAGSVAGSYTVSATGPTGYASGSFSMTNTKATTSISTQVSTATAGLGTPFNDAATLSGGVNAIGTITFNVYKDDSTCAGVPVFTSTKTVSGNGQYTSDDFTPSTAGTYYWIASYSGDANNAGISGTCGDANETVTVGQATPTVTTTASGAVALGGQVSDQATLAGGFNPTGTITFKLYNNNTCAGAPVFTSAAISVSGNGNYGSGNFTPGAAGNYYWLASYSGDSNNAAFTTTCGDPGETVAVGLASPTINTTASGNVTLGGAIHDTATVSGGASPTGTVTFRLYGPDDTSCGGSAIVVGTSSLSGGSATSPDVVPGTPGTYRWIATYNGDSNNAAVAGTCTAPNESVVVNKITPTLSTTASAGGGLGTAVSDSATLSGGLGPPTGSITFKLYGPNDATCGNAPVFTSAAIPVNGNNTYGSGNFTPTAPGTYRWIASYSGDTYNAAVTGACNDANEFVTITTGNTTTSVTANFNPSKFGQSVTFTATVNPVAPASTTPTGTVQFSIDGNPVGGPITLSGNTAQLSVSSLTVTGSPHTVTAQYNGDTNYNNSTGSLAGGQTVNKADTTTSVTSSQNASANGQNVTFTATVAAVAPGAGTPTGTVTFTIDGGNVGTITLSGGQAQFSTSTLTPGSHTVSATYNSDANFNGSSGSLPGGQTVNSPTPTPTPTATATSTPTPTPTATATATATATPTATATATPTASATPAATPTATPTSTPAQALNIATRLRVDTGDKVMIGGFIIRGNASKPVVLRGMGPSLTNVGLPAASLLQDPVLELHGPNGALITSNDNWVDSPQKAQIQGTIFQPTDNRESVILATLQPGAYTAILSGAGNTTGIGIVEIYDVNQAVDSDLANISTRGFVQTGDNVMIGGFVLGGNQNATRIVVRALGPSLSAFGLSNLMADPTLQLRNANGTVMISNDNWTDDPVSAAQLVLNGLAPTNGNESAIFAALAPPGQFTAIVVDKNGSFGIALVEIYNLR